MHNVYSNVLEAEVSWKGTGEDQQSVGYVEEKECGETIRIGGNTGLCVCAFVNEPP